MRLPLVLVALSVGVGASRSASADEPRAPAPTSNEQDEDYETVHVKSNARWASPRGVGDLRIKRDVLEASPRLQASELLSAAPGVFVDHEDGGGLGNDVFFRGFDLNHGSGVEMRVGNIPLNIPVHIRGQGYADPNFILPEVVRSVRVLPGPYDPRQGDAAIAGSAYFDLGVERRGYQLKSQVGSFEQKRVVAIAAPPSSDSPETFAAFGLRHTNGFGVRRRAFHGTAIGQYAFDVGPRDRVRVITSASTTSAERPGVVRQDDVAAGRVSLDGSYPFLADGQGASSSHLILGADYDHVTEQGSHLEVAPWVMVTSFRARQNYTGALETSQREPALSGLGDLYETTNREHAAGLSTRYRTLPKRWGAVELISEGGVLARAGRTSQSKSLLVPSTLVAWDRRIDAGVDTLDVGGFVDLDVRIARRLRVSGGPRVDALSVSVDDRLPPIAASRSRSRSTFGAVMSPRATVAYDAGFISPALSYGEGFRSVDAQSVAEGVGRPYSKVRSAEAGVSMKAPSYSASAAYFETHVQDELVFEAEAGGLETQKASTRRGLVASVVSTPRPWLLISSALSVVRAVYDTKRTGTARLVPSVPPVLARTDVALRGTLTEVGHRPLVGRVGLGYTFLSPRPLTDQVRSAASHIMNASAALLYDHVEVGVDAYNVLGLRYPDEAAVYASNFSVAPGPHLASIATHETPAPPTTILGTVSAFF